MQFLLDVGLDYLTLARSAATLSGGEAQRIRLASQIGSGLVGVLYVLDEPSIGLHQRDNKRLIGTLLRLRDLGNTVIVVEHDEETIRVADHIVDVGPGGGGARRPDRPLRPGGRPRRHRGQPGVDHRSVPVGEAVHPGAGLRRPGSGEFLTVKGAREHNLHDVDAAFPLGCLVAVTGVSGSGKSTLINDILLRSLSHQVHRSKAVPGLHRTITGVEHIDKVVEVGPGPHRPHPPLQPGHLHRGVRPHPPALLPDLGGQGAGLPARPVLLQRQGRPVRGLLGGRHPADRDALPPRRLRALRGLPRGPVQPGHPRGHVPGEEHRRGPRPVVRGGAGLLRQAAPHRPSHADPGGRGPGVHQARASRPPPCREARPSGSSSRRS